MGCTANIRQLSEKYVFQYEKHRKYVHYGVDTLLLSAEEIDDNVGDNAESDAFGNAVEQRHCDYAEVGGDRVGVVVLTELDFRDGAEHEEAHDDERRSCCECGDSCEQRCKEH